jgi:hypothetical protein
LDAGDMLRAIADYGLNNGIKFNLIGIDANNFTIKHATSLSRLIIQIKGTRRYFAPSFKERKYDSTSLHFNLATILGCRNLNHHRYFYKILSLGIVINDLHRSAIAVLIVSRCVFCF